MLFSCVIEILGLKKNFFLDCDQNILTRFISCSSEFVAKEQWSLLLIFKNIRLSFRMKAKTFSGFVFITLSSFAAGWASQDVLGRVERQAVFLR